MLKELTHPMKSKALLGYTDEKIRRLEEFLTNEKVDLCPICNRDSWLTFSDPKYEAKAKEVLNQVAKNTKTWKRFQRAREEALSDYKKPMPRLQDYAKNLIYTVTIDNKRVKVPVHKIIHLSLVHPRVLERLITEKLIQCSKIAKLHSAIHEKKSQEKLSQVFRVIPVEERLPKHLKGFKKWLEEGN